MTKTKTKTKTPVVTLLPHQIETMVRELKRPEYAGLTPGAAYERVTSRTVLRRLTRTRYLTDEQWAKLREKDRERIGRDRPMLVLPTLPQIATGLPGFPNKILRADFDAAFLLARST